MTNNEHIWFDEQIATHLAHGLDTDERARFEQHRAACPDCAAKLAQAQAADNETRELFAPVAPSNDFEDRIVQRLRNENPRRRWIHPAVRRGAIAAAAMLALGTAGYVAYEWMNPSSAEQHAIATASNLRQSDGSLRIYNQNGGPYPADVPRMVLRAREAINEARYADA
jgi:anti-sigma factor RsiW